MVVPGVMDPPVGLWSTCLRQCRQLRPFAVVCQR